MEAACIWNRPDTAVCNITGSLDFRSADDFRQLWEPLLNGGTRNFVLDFSGAGGLDKMGLGTILALHKQLRKTGGRVLFAAPSPAVRVVIGITKCDRVFGNYASVASALHDLN